MGFSTDEDKDINHLRSVNKMDEHIEKPSIFNHEKEDAMISSRNALGSAVFVRTKRPKCFRSRILIVNHRTKVFKTVLV